jgi:hypothetical protein
LDGIIYPKYDGPLSGSLYTIKFTLKREKNLSLSSYDTLHHWNKPHLSSFKQQMVPREQSLYTLKHSIDHIDQLVLEQPIITAMSLPIKMLKGWIKLTDSFIKQALRHQLRQLLIYTHAITQLFKPKHRNLGTAIQKPPRGTNIWHSKLNYSSQTQLHAKDNLQPHYCNT